MGIPYETFGQLAEAILEHGAKRATKFLNETEVVKATLHGKRRSHSRIVVIVFTLGRPNYSEREWIKKVRAKGGRFPQNRIRLKFQGTRKRR